MNKFHRPNILYIMTDQQRFDSVSCYGKSICRTRALDTLAASGVRFDNAYTVCALCSPARASMLTGLYPHNHRMWNNNNMMQWARRELPDDVRLISEDLVASGYNCGYSGKWHCGHDKVPSTYGFVGMDVPDYGNFSRTEEYKRYAKEKGLSPPELIERITIGQDGDVGAGTEAGPVEATGTYFVAEYAIELMKKFNEERKAGGKPFMMFVSFWGPRHSCCIPEPYASMYDPAGIEPWPNFGDTLEGKPRIQDRFRRSFYPGGRSEPWEKWQRLIAKYWGYCTFIDDQIARMISALDDMGCRDDTVVFFSTDHGDMTGSHGGFWDKGEFMYEEIYHIPLIVSWPGLTSGAVCDKFVSNMDLAATALDVAGVPLPDRLDARSLLPLVRDPRADWRDDLMCEYHGHRYLYSQRMVRWENYKFIFNAPDYDELYDLEKDPHELKNVINDSHYSNVAEEGRRRLLKWIKDSADPLEFAASHMLSFGK